MVMDRRFQRPSFEGGTSHATSVIIPKNRQKLIHPFNADRNQIFEHRATVRVGPSKKHRPPQESRAATVPTAQERVRKSRNSRQKEQESRDTVELDYGEALYRAAVRSDSVSSSPSEHRAASTKSNRRSSKKRPKSSAARCSPQHEEELHYRDWSRHASKCPNSDWTIHVYRKKQTPFNEFSWDSRQGGEDRRDSYYIHTKALDRLPEHRAPLFEQIFFDHLEEIGENQSQLIIEDKTAARGFGILLDFLYAKTEKEEVEILSNVKRAKALYRIAEYFNAQTLKDRITSFYDKTTKQFKGDIPVSVSSGNSDSRSGRRSSSSFFSFPPSEGLSSPWNPTDFRLSAKSRKETSGKRHEQNSASSSSKDSDTSYRSLLGLAKPKTEGAALDSPVSVSSFMNFPSTIMLEMKEKGVETETASSTKRNVEQMDALDPEVLLEVLKQRKSMNIDTRKIDFETVSCLIALCVKRNKKKLTPTLFYQLTGNDFIPFIDQEAALEFLAIEEDLGFWTDRNNFSSVQSRCIRSLLANWEGLRKKFPSDEAYWKSLRTISPSILGILLMHASGTSQREDDMSSITDFCT